MKVCMLHINNNNKLLLLCYSEWVHQSTINPSFICTVYSYICTVYIR